MVEGQGVSTGLLVGTEVTSPPMQGTHASPSKQQVEHSQAHERSFQASNESHPSLVSSQIGDELGLFILFAGIAVGERRFGLELGEHSSLHFPSRSKHHPSSQSQESTTLYVPLISTVRTVLKTDLVFIEAPV